VTELYETARYKMADCIVNGKSLRIFGANVCLDNQNRKSSRGKGKA
jgi:predicted DNA-binding protein (UPF0251 family)